MAMIGESSGKEKHVMDRPIYLQVYDREDGSNCFWYLIEEKEGKIQDLDRKNKNIMVLKQSETDEIRELQLPSLYYPFKAKLVVKNSRIYLFGGFSGDGDGDGFSRNVEYLDTSHTVKAWFDGPKLCLNRRTLSVLALESSGLFIAFGMRDKYPTEKVWFETQPLLEFLDRIWLPAPPIPEPEVSQINDARLLAVTDTKVYMYADRMGLCFDVEKGLSRDARNSEWNIFDRSSFHGSWCPGAVIEFCSNSYLFLFGIHGLEYRLKSKSPIHTQKLWVYDLNNCTWLPLPVQGLPDDGTVLPDPYQNSRACTHLLQINQNQRNKVALIWSRSSPPVTEIHCSKFIIDCTTDSGSQHPEFRATVISSGCYHLKGGGQLLNCAVQVIGKD